MLSKLLKYEFKATGRIYGGLYLAILAAAALLGAFFRFPALASDFPFAVVTIVYLMLCVAIAVITALTIIQRFTRNLLGREGYLMHTLPVTPAQLILSKLISSMVWLLCSILVIALSLGVFFLCGMLNVNGIFSDWASAVRDFRLLADILQHVLNVSGFMLLLTAIEWLATLVCSILCLYTACMIGHQFKQHFALVGIAAFVILNIVQNRLVALLPYTTNTWGKGRAGREQLVGEAQRVATLDYRTVSSPNVRADLTFTPDRAATGSGLLLWFDAELAEGIGFSNAPGQPPLIYGGAFFPWPAPVQLDPTWTLAVTLRANLVENDYVWRWRTVGRRAGEAAPACDFQQSTFFAGPANAAALARREAGYVPRLAPAGEIDRAILVLADGTRTQGEIAQALAAQFPALFGDAHAALSRVSGTLKRYQAQGAAR